MAQSKARFIAANFSANGRPKNITGATGAGSGGGVDSASTISLIQSTVDSAYIGTKVDFTRGEFTTQRSQYTATASQTAFSHSSIDPTHLDVYLNGVLQVVGTDYNASATAVTFTTGVDSGHSVTIVERRGRVATQRGLVSQSYYYISWMRKHGVSRCIF